jgi:iron complex outermembrane recepter protein
VLQPFSVNSTNGPLSVTSPGITYNDFSWRAGVQYHATSDMMFYAQVSRAYKGPGLNFGPSLTSAQFALNQAAVAPEIGFNYEAGLRSQWLDRQLTVNLTGFYERYTNFQVTAVLPTTPTSFTTVNAPLLIAQGVELEYAWQPRETIPGLRVDGNVVWNDTHYGDFKNAPCYSGQIISSTVTTAQGVCAASGAGGANVENVSGLRAVGAPEWQFNLTARYERPIGHGFQAFGQVHTVYNSEIQYGVNANPLSIQKAYDLTDFTAGFGPESRKWTVSFYLRNAFDTRFASRISMANPTINQTITFDAVRSAGMSLDVAF